MPYYCEKKANATLKKRDEGEGKRVNNGGGRGEKNADGSTEERVGLIIMCCNKVR